MPTRRTRAAKATAAAPVADEAFEELDEVTADDELEELDEAPAETPAKRTRKATAAKATGDEKGSAWLAEHVNEQTGSEYDARGIRMLLRRLANDEESDFSRAIGDDRSRYAFKGPNDPAVKAVVRLVKSGAAKTGTKAERGEAPVKKTTKAAAPAAEATPARRTRKAAAAPAAPAKATRRTRRAAADA